MTETKVIAITRNSSIELAPSILAANFAQLAADARQALEGGGSLLHLDVMDGHFVPNITLGPPVVESLRKALPDVIFDCHLMIENPDDLIPAFADAGCKPAVVINPATPVHTLDEVLDIVHHVLVMSVNPGFGGQKFIRNTLKKMETLASIREQRRLDFRIEVDGGVAMDTVADVVRAGGEILVAGSAVFGHGDIAGHAKQLLEAARSAKLTRA
jgi:ribulose-phosphate 3-epimerase